MNAVIANPATGSPHRYPAATSASPARAPSEEIASSSDLAAAAGMEQSAVSHQLRMLRHLGLVTGQRTGRMVVYALFDNHVAMLLDEAVYHAEHLRLGVRDTPATGAETG